MREYALATGGQDPVYTADPADVPPEEVVAPPTFAACFTVTRAAEVLVADTELGAHPALIHSSQEYDFHRPVRVGDVLECTPWIADIVSRTRVELLTLQVDCVDAGTKDPVVTGRGSLVFLTGSVAGSRGETNHAPP
ncbi:MAG: MaoC family dehydratase N-terminal domain-containing protein [Actinomycetota bacterium]|nr:MaoC family dehydratase N-terminal domain-containing protein [Actinomycetota bacterium]